MSRKLLTSLEDGQEYAFRLLGIRDYSHQEMHQKLTGKGLGLKDAGVILKKLEARGLISDRRYALDLAAFYIREKLWGRQPVIHKLLQKGIALNLAQQVTDQIEKDESSQERLKRALHLKLKGQGLSEMLPQGKRRLVNYLRQRGFLWEDIMEALREAGGSVEE